MAAVDCIEVHGKTDVVLLHHELNHAAPLEEVWGIAYCEDVGVAEDGKVFANIFAFEGADEDDAASLRFCYVGVEDVNGAMVNGLIRSKGFEGWAERVSPENADVEG